MNQRRKLLNAARRGDTKAISRLFELYQVRVLSGEQLAKVNRTSTYMTPVKTSQSAKSKAQEKGAKATTSKSAKKSTNLPAKASNKKATKTAKRKSTHK
jgi:hypothetical protein